MATTEAIYGHSSIELANELHKYAEILVNAADFAGALGVVERARTVFTLNYGEQCQAVHELDQLRTDIKHAIAN